MIEKILIPDIGDFDAVEVIEVLVAVGDTVSKEQSILVLESDKATLDVPAPVAGVVQKIVVAAGDKVKQGSHIVDIEVAAAAEPAPESSESSAPPVAEPVVEPAATTTSEPAAPADDTPPAAASPAGSGSSEEIRVPNIGDFQEVEVIELLVNVGDEVTAEQSLLTLESDKATLDVPTPLSGRIEQILVSAGDKVSEGSLIAMIATTASASSPPPPPAPVTATVTAAPPTTPTAEKTAPPPASVQKQPPLAPVVATKSAKPHAGPAVRHFARELGVDLSVVQGSGRKGRILKEDVTQYVKAAMSQPQESGFSSFLAVPEVDFRQFGEVEITPLSRINKLSAATLHRNWVAAPHVTQFAEADITDMEDFRKSLAEEAKRSDYKMTPLVFLIKAAVAALRQFGKFNASLMVDGENLAVKKYYHIGVAVDTPGGLVVPVVRDADKKGLADIARELADLSARARAGKLKREDMQGGCFTISSLGGIGGTAFTPILNLPEVAILGVSRSEIKPHWDAENNQFVPRLKLPLALSYDHRVVDGADGARFITYYTELLGDIRRLTL